MRERHNMRKSWMRRLDSGEVVVLLNGDLKIARLIDPQGGVHDYYAPKGERFDEAALYNMVERGMKVSLEEGRNTKVVHLRANTTPRKAAVPAATSA